MVASAVVAVGQQLLGVAQLTDDLLGGVAASACRWRVLLPFNLRAMDSESPRAWLSTVTTRLAVDPVRSARMRRETYVGS